MDIYCCAEQYFQVKKVEFFNRDDLKLQIPAAEDPVSMTRLGDIVKPPKGSPWHVEKDKIMKSVVLSKLEQNPSIAKYLLSTGSAQLIEATHHQYWGAGCGAKDSALCDGSFKGKNRMGGILAEVRTQLKKTNIFQGERDIAMKYARRRKTEAAFVQARTLRNEYNRGIHKAKCDYIINQLQRYKNDQKGFWKCIQSVMPSKETAKCIREVINPITGEKCDVKESVEVINRFFFTNIGPNMTAKLPWSSDPGTTFESEVFLENVELLNNQDVIKLVKEINIYKSSGLPNINSRLLKDGFMALIDQFTFVLNLSLKTGIVPDTWKLGIRKACSYSISIIFRRE